MKHYVRIGVTISVTVSAADRYYKSYPFNAHIYIAIVTTHRSRLGIQVFGLGPMPDCRDRRSKLSILFTLVATTNSARPGLDFKWKDILGVIKVVIRF